jgi:hypothetical protein
LYNFKKETKEGMKITTLLFLNSLYFMMAHAHGFTANYVNITFEPASKKYRVEVEYTHIEVGEYRKAFAEFSDKKEALLVLEKIAKGAHFFIGNLSNTIHFHESEQKKTW